jgi:hypothetical protein
MAAVDEVGRGDVKFLMKEYTSSGKFSGTVIPGV